MLRLVVIAVFSLVLGVMPAWGFAASEDADGCQQASMVDVALHHAQQATDDCAQHQHKNVMPCGMDDHCASPTCQSMIVDLADATVSLPKVLFVFELIQVTAPMGHHMPPPEEPPRALA